MLSLISGDKYEQQIMNDGVMVMVQYKIQLDTAYPSGINNH